MTPRRLVVLTVAAAVVTAAGACSADHVTVAGERTPTTTAPHGVGVFVIHPGDVDTAMSQHLMSDEMAKWLPGIRKYFAENFIPVERAAELVCWLAAGKGDALSGRYLSVHYDVEQMVAEVETIGEKELYTLRLQTL